MIGPIGEGHLGDLAEASRLLDPALFAKLAELSRVERLLIATDYDGTVAPIVDRPERAFPLDLTVTTMRALAALPKTHTAVISGRSLRDLAAMSRLPREVHLVGSHGLEDEIDAFAEVPAELLSRRTALRTALLDLTRELPDLTVELKPAGAAVHVRGRTDAERTRVASFVERVVEEIGLEVTAGREVYDLSLVPASKATALAGIRGDLGAEAVLYIGDDVSDEDALASLGEGDLGIAVGTVSAEVLSGPAAAAARETAASFALRDPDAVALVLTSLFELRRNWVFGRSAVPIERHSLLSNGHSTALVDPAGRVCWMPHPLPHAASVFSEILGTAAAGYFSAAPVPAGAGEIAALAGDARAERLRPLGQRYREATMTVETRWAGLTVTDYLAPVPEDSLDTVLVRVLTGDAETEIRFAPRIDYGAQPTGLVLGEPGVVHVAGTSEPMALFAPGAEFTLVEENGSHTAVARVRPADLPDGRLVCAFAAGGGYPELDGLLGGGEEHIRARTEGLWANWARTLELPGTAAEGVARSALTLRALCHAPTGGVLAAATSSLPEGIGGVRNWDYRYTWLRDGAMTVRALLDLGSTAEAEGFFSWLRGILAQTAGPEHLHPLYSVDGSALSTEAVLEHLPGYAGSRPVRIGNAAEHQVQLDVFGPVAELIHDFAMRTESLADAEWHLLCQMVLAVSRRWREPDHGIWEARRAPKHNVYTKVMCWVTIDRAIAVAERFGRPMPGPWRGLREEIAAEVLERGYSERVGSYTVAYDDDDLDSAALFIGLSGLLPADDPRFLSTVDAIERELREGPTVFRYRYDDGLPGLEGGFHICTTWLIEAFVLVGRVDDARSLFRQLDALRGPTGLLAEEYDPAAEQHLGNHPQAYSHLGYIRVARMLDALGA